VEKAVFLSRRAQPYETIATQLMTL